jgi:hypoxanthine phosphoribosyltransferase
MPHHGRMGDSMTHQADIEVYIDEQQIHDRVALLADEIDRDYRAAGELLLVGVLKGSFVFLADLARDLTIPNRIDFVALSSYGDSMVTTGAVRLIMDLRTDITDRHVLVVEDIVDTGHTLDYLLRTLGARRPASLRCCTLLRKQERHEVDIDVDYVGFDIQDIWVVGYGLDYAEDYRTLPYIGRLRK